MIGIVVVIGGMLFTALSVIDLTSSGGIEAFWDDFLRSPRAWGLIAGIAGLLVTLIGLVRTMAGSAAAPGAYNKVVEAEFSAGGVMAVVAGVVLLALAAALIVAPDVFQGALDDLWSRANSG